MTTPDPYTDVNPAPTGTEDREQDRAYTHQEGNYADPRIDPDTGTGDAPASGTNATATRAAPGSGTDESGTKGMGENEPLVTQQRSADYSARWDQVKGGFVDEPRQAVAAADELVTELLEELQELFRGQRRDIEQGLDASEASTEDLRLALRRYRSFFDRLLSI